MENSMKKILTLLAVIMTVASMGLAEPMKLEPAQQKNLNVFFSNFSEAQVASFSQGALTDQTIVDFALRHLYLNKFKSLKPSKDGLSVTATTEQVDTAAIKYFGQKPAQHKEKTYSIPLADGEAFFFSQLDTLEDIGSDTFKASGTIYSTGSGGTPDVHATPADWEKAGEEVSVAGKFSALIKAQDERHILVEYLPTEIVADETAAAASVEPEKAESAPKLDKEHVKNLVTKDIFDWQLLDEAGKIALIQQIKQVWRANGHETDANAMEAGAIIEKMVLGDQANVFESACKAAGIDMEPYWKIYNDQE
jgi:hypothetical protein